MEYAIHNGFHSMEFFPYVDLQCILTCLCWMGKHMHSDSYVHTWRLHQRSVIKLNVTDGKSSSISVTFDVNKITFYNWRLHKNAKKN